MYELRRYIVHVLNHVVLLMLDWMVKWMEVINLLRIPSWDSYSSWYNFKYKNVAYDQITLLIFLRLLCSIIGNYESGQKTENAPHYSLQRISPITHFYSFIIWRSRLWDGNSALRSDHQGWQLRDIDAKESLRDSLRFHGHRLDMKLTQLSSTFENWTREVVIWVVNKYITLFFVCDIDSRWPQFLSSHSKIPCICGVDGGLDLKKT